MGYNGIHQGLATDTCQKDALKAMLKVTQVTQIGHSNLKIRSDIGIEKYTGTRYTLRKDNQMNANDSTNPRDKFKDGVPDIRYDNVFKAVFANDANPKSRAALSGLLSAITGDALTVVTLSQNEPTTGFFGEKQIRYDINCKLADETRCNVEITIHPVSCEAVRIEYYTAKMHMGQPTKGKYFDDIVRTYQVSIINKAVIADEEYLHVFQFYDSDRRISLGGRMSIFTVELPKVRKTARKKAVSDMTPAERWALYFLYNANRSKFGRKLLDEIKRKEEGVRMATEVMQSFSAEEIRYLQQISEEKYETDYCNHMNRCRKSRPKSRAQKMA
jgi:predicted transposase/invertase (TIGR01784 family)